MGPSIRSAEQVGLSDCDISNVFNIGGVAYRLKATDGQPIQGCRNPWFRHFLCPPKGYGCGDEIEVAISPFHEERPELERRLVLEHKGRTHLLKDETGGYCARTYGDYLCKELLWETSFSGNGACAHSETAEKVRVEDGTWALPGIGANPHFRFMLPSHLAWRGGLWVHCAGALRGGRYCLLAGRSGRGKSTIARIMHDSGLFQIGSDEVNIVRIREGKATGYGTPWYSSAQLAANHAGEISALIFLDHGKDNAVEAMTKAEATKRMLKQILLPWWDETEMRRTLAALDDLICAASCWQLRFRPDESVADYLADFADGL